MNFRLILLVLMTTILFGGCGVKAPPQAPNSEALTSYEEQFLDQDKDKKEKKSSEDTQSK